MLHFILDLDIVTSEDSFIFREMMSRFVRRIDYVIVVYVVSCEDLS